jgi:hypothetical protein
MAIEFQLRFLASANLAAAAAGNINLIGVGVAES